MQVPANPGASLGKAVAGRATRRRMQVEWVEIRPSAAGDSKYAAGGGRPGRLYALVG